MADVLSQNQIDELLKSMHSDAGEEQIEIKKGEEKETKYSKYDFYSPKKFTKEKMKIIRSVFEQYARIITSQINGIFRIMTDITVLEVKESRYYEFVNSLSENDSVTIVKAVIKERSKKNVPLMLHITPGLIITLINHMLGGGDNVVKVEDGYRYSEVELALYRRIVEYFTTALKDGFANHITLDFKPERVEENLGMNQEMGLDETVAIILLNVDVTGIAVERIKLCIPGTLLESIFTMIDSRKHSALGFSDVENREMIMENLQNSKLPITAQLATIELGLSDIYHLQEGDVIDLNKPQNSDVRLFVEEQPWFTGKMGVYKKNIAIRITERITNDTLINS